MQLILRLHLIRLCFLVTHGKTTLKMWKAIINAEDHAVPDGFGRLPIHRTVQIGHTEIVLALSQVNSLSVEEIYGLMKTIVGADADDNETNDESIELCAGLGLLLPVSSPSTEKCLDDSRFLLLWATDHGKEHLVKV